MAHDNARGSGMDGREVPKKTKGTPGRAQEVQGGREASPVVERLTGEMAELKSLSEHYHRAIEISLDAMVAADEEGKITLWNPAAEKLFGYPAREAIGADVVRLVPPGLRERHRQGMERFLSTGQGAIIGRVVEVEGLRSDGSLVPVEMSLSAERVDGRWVFMAILRDDTARRRLEGELKTRLVEVERLARTMVGREIKMEELRKEIAALKKDPGQKA